MPSPQSIGPTLQILVGRLAGRVFVLDRDLTIVGRNADCDVVLSAQSVSRKHAAISRKAAGYELKDIGSTRGTFVNGQKLTAPLMLEDGQTLQIGELLLTFRSSATAVKNPESADGESALDDELTDSVLADVLVNRKSTEGNDARPDLPAPTRERARIRTSVRSRVPFTKRRPERTHSGWSAVKSAISSYRITSNGTTPRGTD